MAMLHKTFTGDISVAEGERAVVAKISTIGLDRDMEVLLPLGCDASEYEKNPVVMFNHDYYKLPVGKCVSLRKDAASVMTKTVFAARPPAHVGEWFPDTLLSLYQQGVLNGFSVGFTPIESRSPTAKDLAQFGDGITRVYSKWRLYEYSVAALPANQEALALAVSKGMVSKAFAKTCLNCDVDAVSVSAELHRPRKLFIVIDGASMARPVVKSASEIVSDSVKKHLDRLRGVIYSD